MQGFGRVEREDKEPVFHAPWEAEVLAMMRAGAGQGFYNIDEFRHAIERMRPADYLAATYYEKWLDGIARLFVEKGIVTEAEMQARTAFFAAPFAGDRLAAFLVRFAGPLARRSASNSAARSRVISSTVSPDRREALVSPSVT